MQKGIKKGLKIAGYTAGSLVGVLALYVATDYGLSRIAVPAEATDEPKEVELFIRSNGAHTDIVLPIRTAHQDWSREFPVAHTLAADPNMRYIAFGWGDKGFYLDTPTWADLKFSTAFKAAFHLSTAAMHVTFYRDMPEGPDTVRMHLTRAQYARLIAYIEASFRRDAAGRVQHIAGHSYGQDDAFYEAHRVYSFLYTCNTWANNALKISGQRASWWSASDNGIFYHYRPELQKTPETLPRPDTTIQP
jgi:uncharacterized protein (TIGR02117 family)